METPQGDMSDSASLRLRNVVCGRNKIPFQVHLIPKHESAALSSPPAEGRVQEV